MILQEYELALLSSSSSPNNEERLELMGCIYDQENSEIVAEFNICVVVKQIYGFIFHYLFFFCCLIANLWFYFSFLSYFCCLIANVIALPGCNEFEVTKKKKKRLEC
jgi:hypothetical protein